MSCQTRNVVGLVWVIQLHFALWTPQSFVAIGLRFPPFIQIKRCPVIAVGHSRKALVQSSIKQNQGPVAFYRIIGNGLISVTSPPLFCPTSRSPDPLSAFGLVELHQRSATNERRWNRDGACRLAHFYSPSLSRRTSGTMPTTCFRTAYR